MMIECEACGGSGDAWSEFFTDPVNCAECDGSGTVPFVRDVNLHGLGDRRGLALEEVSGRRTYEPGTLDVIDRVSFEFAVYVDGVRVGTRPTYDTAIACGKRRMGIAS